MIYVIGKSDVSFIQIRHSPTMWDGNGKLWHEIDKVSYDCLLEGATIFHGYDEAEKVLREIRERISEIEFANILVLGQIIDERNGFDKVSYADKLRIFELIPTLMAE